MGNILYLNRLGSAAPACRVLLRQRHPLRNQYAVLAVDHKDESTPGSGSDGASLCDSRTFCSVSRAGRQDGGVPRVTRFLPRLATRRILLVAQRDYVIAPMSTTCNSACNFILTMETLFQGCMNPTVWYLLANQSYHTLLERLQEFCMSVSEGDEVFLYFVGTCRYAPPPPRKKKGHAATLRSSPAFLGVDNDQPRCGVYIGDVLDWLFQRSPRLIFFVLDCLESFDIQLKRELSMHRGLSISFYNIVGDKLVLLQPSRPGNVLPMGAALDRGGAGELTSTKLRTESRHAFDTASSGWSTTEDDVATEVAFQLATRRPNLGCEDRHVPVRVPDDLKYNLGPRYAQQRRLQRIGSLTSCRVRETTQDDTASSILTARLEEACSMFMHREGSHHRSGSLVSSSVGTDDSPTSADRSTDDSTLPSTDTVQETTDTLSQQLIRSSRVRTDDSSPTTCVAEEPPSMESVLSQRRSAALIQRFQQLLPPEYPPCTLFHSNREVFLPSSFVSTSLLTASRCSRVRSVGHFLECLEVVNPPHRIPYVMKNFGDYVLRSGTT